MNNSALKTHSCGDPVLINDYRRCFSANTNFLMSISVIHLMSRTNLHKLGDTPISNSFAMSRCGLIVLNADEKSINRVLASGAWLLEMLIYEVCVC